MGVKSQCTKCGRRFVDWGAEKIKKGEGCDDCEGEFLEVVGFDSAQAKAKKKPALKRKRSKKPARVEQLLPPSDFERNAPSESQVDGNASGGSAAGDLESIANADAESDSEAADQD